MKNILLVVTAAILVSGCIVVRDPYHNPHRAKTVVMDDDYEAYAVDPVGSVVVIDRGHVHSDHCGHYWYNGRWYHSHGHVHGPRCGHTHVDGIWLHAGAVTIKAGHVHSDHCGHFQHNGGWYYMRDHRHGPGCGHTHRNGVWIAVKF